MKRYDVVELTHQLMLRIGPHASALPFDVCIDIVELHRGRLDEAVRTSLCTDAGGTVLIESCCVDDVQAQFAQQLVASGEHGAATTHHLDLELWRAIKAVPVGRVETSINAEYLYSRVGHLLVDLDAAQLALVRVAVVDKTRRLLERFVSADVIARLDLDGSAQHARAAQQQCLALLRGSLCVRVVCLFACFVVIRCDSFGRISSTPCSRHGGRRRNASTQGRAAAVDHRRDKRRYSTAQTRVNELDL
jgi:hypothetical protein